MYDRRLDDRVLSFGHAGRLYEQSFVMYDRETESLWVHVTGRAERGPLRGKELSFIPSTVTTWKTWRESNPGTTVLPGRRRGGFMGTYVGITSPGSIGLVVRVNFKAKLYPFTALRERVVVNDRFNGLDIVVVFDGKDNTASAWSRRTQGRLLSFRPPRGGTARRDRLIFEDAETGSRWSAAKGEALEGPLRAARLEPVQSHPILIDRYRALHTDGLVFDGAEE